MTDPATEALAEVWASIDGKYEAFAKERAEGIPLGDPRCTVHYEGYVAEAEEMVRRLASRGYVIVAAIDPMAEAAAIRVDAKEKRDRLRAAMKGPTKRFGQAAARGIAPASGMATEGRRRTGCG